MNLGGKASYTGTDVTSIEVVANSEQPQYLQLTSISKSPQIKHLATNCLPAGCPTEYIVWELDDDSMISRYMRLTGTAAMRMVRDMAFVLKSRALDVTRSKTARLLLLEFTVVLAGVLAAQVLQDWFTDRAERARAVQQRAGVVAALHNSAELGDIRVRMYACMRDRIERTRDLLSSSNGSQEFAAALTVPEQMILDDTGWESARAMLTKYFGTDDAMMFSSAQYLIDQMDAAQDIELAAWERLTLLRQENGAASPRLKAELQIALADAARTNRLLYEAGKAVYGRSRVLKVPMHAKTLTGFSTSNKLCAAMVAYPPDRHADAAAKGMLADGTPLHRRLHPLTQNRQ